MTFNKQRLIVVLGMHRSGTSIVTRALNSLGATVGEELIPPGDDNPTGFWEDKDVVEFNDFLLDTLGFSYESIAIFPENISKDLRVEKLKLEAIQLLRKKIRTNPLWVIKDPRMCRLLSFWNLVFTHLDFKVEYVIVARNPLSVAHSLKVRNQFPLSKSLLLWLEHYIEAIVATNNQKRLFVEYDRFMDNPAAQLKRISEFFSLFENKEAEYFLNSFLSQDLRHNQHQPEDLSQSAEIFPSVIFAYDLMIKASQDDGISNQKYFNDEWCRLKVKLEEISPILKFLNERDKHALLRDIEFESLKKNYLKIDDELNAKIKERDTQIAERDAQIAERDAQIAERDTQIALRDTQIAERDAQIAERDAQIAEQKLINTLFETSHSWKITRPLRCCGLWIRKILH